MPAGSAVIRYAGTRGVVWRIKYADADGKQTMETVGSERDGVTRKKAEAELRERLVKVDKGGWRKPAPLTFETAIAEWFAATEVENAWRPQTTRQYRTVVARLNATFGVRRLADVGPSDIAAYKAAKLEKYGASSVSRDLSILHAFFAWAVVVKGCASNPTVGVHHPRKPGWKGQALRPEEVQALLRAFTDEQARTAFLTLVLTGVRRSELQALRWRDVDLIENRLRVVDSKTDAGSRSIALPTMLAEQLWQWRRATSYNSDEGRVFCHPERGSVYRYELFAKALRRAYKAAGMTFPEGMRAMHDLRVTMVTNDALAGANPVALMTKAGHTNMATTKRYLRLAGIVFPDEAAALEARMLGTEPSTASSTRLAEPQPTSDESAQLESTAVASAHP
jgi:integrase